MSESGLIKCECEHPAFFHVSGRCEGCDGGGGCKCKKSQWDVVDTDLARLRELLGEVKDRVLVFGLYSPDLQSRIQSELKE